MEKTNPLYLYTYVYELFLFILCVFLYSNFKKSTTGIIGSFVFFCILLFFYRNNLGPLERKRNTIISPAECRINFIEHRDNQQIISTYLSPFNKHFMIAPCDCKVVDKIYKPQRETDSECMRHVFQDTHGNMFYLDQIVSKPLHWGWIPSVLYDRCVSFVDIGQSLKQGERYGLIRFGSNMVFGFPSHYSITCVPDTKLNIGEIIGTQL